MNRTCRRCGVHAEGEARVKEVFYPAATTANGVRYRTACKECSKLAATEWRRAEPEKWRKIHRRAQKPAPFRLKREAVAAAEEAAEKRNAPYVAYVDPEQRGYGIMRASHWDAAGAGGRAREGREEVGRAAKPQTSNAGASKRKQSVPSRRRWAGSSR